jgi:hypothetical protein
LIIPGLLQLMMIYHVITHGSCISLGIAPNPSLVATITFDLSIGPEAADPKEISSAQEHLKPIEQQLIVLEQAMEGILDEMEYLTQREASMRDTNGKSRIMHDVVRVMDLFRIHE